MRLMIVGALNGQLSQASKIAMDNGAKVQHAHSIDVALAALRSGKGADLLFVDIKIDIETLILGLEADRIHIPVVACGTHADAAAAVNAIRAGAKEYLPLPPDADLIAAIIAAVARESSSMLFTDPLMARVIALADKIAGSSASVLITGESGTGKEVIAKYLHSKSKRAQKPFICINCASIPEHLLESELFGHEKGAFTGAINRRIGKFEEADGGTLLLDEISEMDFRLQAKLLRALQERVIDRIGGTKPIPVDLRILATSNRDLLQEVSASRFREDLFFRLNVVNLRIPPLRERKQDIVLLAEHFALKYSRANGIPDRVITSPAKTLLLKAPWRGNVRELENTIHRAVLLSDDAGIAEHHIEMLEQLPNHNPAYQSAIEVAEATTRELVGQTVAEVERRLILDTLDHCLGNRTHAATILGISIRTLRNKLNLYNLDMAEPAAMAL